MLFYHWFVCPAIQCVSWSWLWISVVVFYYFYSLFVFISCLTIQTIHPVCVLVEGGFIFFVCTVKLWVEVDQAPHPSCCGCFKAHTRSHPGRLFFFENCSTIENKTNKTKSKLSLHHRATKVSQNLLLRVKVKPAHIFFLKAQTLSHSNSLFVWEARKKLERKSTKIPCS